VEEKLHRDVTFHQSNGALLQAHVTFWLLRISY
jgi:hypothetical protein